MTNDQFVGHAPNITGLTVTAHYSDSTLDHAVDSADLTVAPAEYDEAGAQTLTISYTDEYGTASATQSVTVLAVELSALAVTGDFTDTQYTGAAPTKTGLTFTASYNDGTSETVSASDITVTPATWDASGNPDNLGEQTATFSYTEDGVTKTATKAVVIHRPSSGQVLDMNQEGWIFFDMNDEMKTLLANGHWGPAALFESRGADIGRPAFFVFTENEYENDTPVTAATLGSWLPLYGLGSQGETFAEVGTPNVSGFKPAYGPYAHTDLVDSYVSVRTDGTATMSAGDETLYMVIGTLANALDGTSYKLSDMSTTGRTVYSAIYRKNS